MIFAYDKHLLIDTELAQDWASELRCIGQLGYIDQVFEITPALFCRKFWIADPASKGIARALVAPFDVLWCKLLNQSSH